MNSLHHSPYVPTAVSHSNAVTVTRVAENVITEMHSFYFCFSAPQRSEMGSLFIDKAQFYL